MKKTKQARHLEPGDVMLESEGGKDFRDTVVKVFNTGIGVQVTYREEDTGEQSTTTYMPTTEIEVEA